MTWKGADIIVETKKLKRLLNARYPELVKESVRVDDTGWYNLVLIVGEKWIFRFPKTEEAKSIMTKELHILPQLYATLPISIPQFIYSSNESDPIPYVGYPMIAGRPIFREELADLNEQEQERLAKDIGAFLTALHAFPLEKAFGAAADVSQIKDYYRDLFNNIKNKAFPYMTPALITWTKQIFHDFLTDRDSFRFTPCLLHNDLKPEHFLYDFEQRKLSGVIDFGAMGSGDPAYDFVGINRAYGRAFLKKVIDFYERPLDSAFFHRIDHFYTKIVSFWTLFHGVDTQDQHLMQYALDKLHAHAKKGS